LVVPAFSVVPPARAGDRQGACLFPYSDHEMKTSLILTYIGYAAILAIYGTFAWCGKTPVEGFIALLGTAFIALGTKHVGSSTAKSSTDAATQVMSAVSGPPAVAPVILPTTVEKQ
jgi:hypothetical protein